MNYQRAFCIQIKPKQHLENIYIHNKPPKFSMEPNRNQTEKIKGMGKMKNLPWNLSSVG